MTMDYFDYAAATPMDDTVLQAMQPFFAEKFYNPSATYAPGRAAAEDLQSARVRVAHWLGCRPSEVVFTAGGTEANNLAVHGVMRQLAGSSGSKSKADAADSAGTGPAAGDSPTSPANLVVSAIEHDAVLHPAAEYEVRTAEVLAQGMVDLASLASKIDGSTVLVSVMYANNEIGSIQPIREVAALVAEIRQQRRKSGNALPIYLHTDACQAANYLDLHTARLGVDMMTLNGGKIYGPKQSGVLYVKAGLVLKPLIQGGGQENGMRSGTENVAACVGFAQALDVAQTMRHDETRRMQELQRVFIQQLRDRVPQAAINGTQKKRLPNNIHLTLPGHDNERLLLQLESKGILAAVGSACSASSGEPSHVLRAIGLSDDDARASLRFSLGRTTDAEAVGRAVAALAELSGTSQGKS